MLWNAWGGLYQLDPTPHPAVCHAAVLEHCMVFPWLGANGAFPAALAEKQGAVDTYVSINATAYSVVAPSMGTAALGASLVASTELGVYAASIVLQVRISEWRSYIALRPLTSPRPLAGLDGHGLGLARRPLYATWAVQCHSYPRGHCSLRRPLARLRLPTATPPWPHHGREPECVKAEILMMISDNTCTILPPLCSDGPVLGAPKQRAARHACVC